MLERSPTVRGKSLCLRLLFEMGKWKSLPWLIRAFKLEDPSLRELAEQLALTWLNSNRVFTKPSRLEREAIIDAYAAAEAIMPKTFAEELQSRLSFRLTDGPEEPS
ncbi:hypothetical protein KOR34_15300 [Posidoniimonas corsicana]|uniref:Uncharacterized protein n=1 Tax=Posidoniimonas corsicana TaxID=1938618 RepID=A0A5C5VDC9_9BACT|nr:hypothetical protein [Posidoniimonas corsicana]TWT36624.1 hypothetical protein KOR34_15300 [Posidoniimonas corsicana]